MVKARTETVHGPERDFTLGFPSPCRKAVLTVFRYGDHDGLVTTAAARVPQSERTRAMRQRLLDATVDCLVDKGWSGTSTTLVSQRAGVSRGAQLHHFPTKADLVLAAVDHLSETRQAEVVERAAALPHGPGRTRALLEVLADLFTGPLFVAALELWVAARTDPALEPAVVDLEARFGRAAHRYALEVLEVDEAVEGNRELVQATLDLVRGLGLADTLTDDRRRRSRILDHWAGVLDASLRRSDRGR
jgi:AcrR family transcriptional regulator